jgi:hypothetical protein
VEQGFGNVLRGSLLHASGPMTDEHGVSVGWMLLTDQTEELGRTWRSATLPTQTTHGATRRELIPRNGQETATYVKKNTPFPSFSSVSLSLALLLGDRN